MNDWGFTDYNPAIFEWVDIDPIKRKRVGGLVPDIETDITSFIIEALTESNVPYSKEGNYYRVWGYYVSVNVPTFLSSHSSKTNNSWLFAPSSLILANYY